MHQIDLALVKILMSIVRSKKFWIKLSFLGVLTWLALVAAVFSYMYSTHEERHSDIRSIGLVLEKCIVEQKLKMIGDRPTTQMIQSWFGHGACVRRISIETVKKPELLQNLFSELRSEFPSKNSVSEKEFGAYLLAIIKEEVVKNETRLHERNAQLQNELLFWAAIFG